MANWKAIRDAAHSVGDGYGVWLLDKDLELLADLSGDLGLKFTETPNETTVLSIDLPAEHPAVSWILPFTFVGDDPQEHFSTLVDEGLHIVLEGPGGQSERLAWRVSRITDSQNVIKIEAKSFYRYIEKIALRSDPSRSVNVQLSYRDLRSGDSLRVIKEFLTVNLMRQFQPGGISGGWSLWSPQAWANMNPNLWPAIVNPVHKSESTQFTVLDARFDMAADMFKETLNAAGLMITTELWLEGDPQPAPDHVHLSMPTIWIDVVPRQWDTSATGNALDLLEGVFRSWDIDANAPRVGLGTTEATASGHLPWVVWRPDDMAKITSDFTIVKSEDSFATVGGRSPEVINLALGAASKSLIQGIAAALAAAMPQFSPLIAAAGVFLGDLSAESLKDKFFAWNTFEDADRAAAQGRYRYRDAVGSGDGWTLAAFQQGYQILAAGAGKISIGFTTSDQTVYEWGRHFRAGDQQGLVHRGITYATYLASVSRTRTPKTGWKTDITLGDPTARESYTRGTTRSLKTIGNSISRIKSFPL